MMGEIGTFLSEHPWATSEQIVAELNKQSTKKYTKAQIVDYIEGVMIRDYFVTSETDWQQIGNKSIPSKTRYLLIADLKSVLAYPE